MSDDYEVGYGKPPSKHQFKPGNQLARKKKRTGKRKVAEASLEETIQLAWNSKTLIRDRGEVLKLGPPEILRRRMPELMAKGSPREIAIILEWVARYMPPPEADQIDTLEVVYHRAEGSEVPLPPADFWDRP